jgi:outer membrane protein assembly factor BamB
MEIMDVLHVLSAKVLGLEYSLAIIPTVLIPLTGLTVLLTSIASVIAGWFGIKLKTEGPKQLLEVLLKKKVLFGAIVLNLAIMGMYEGYLYTKHLPSPLFVINYKSKKLATPSNENYANSLGRIHSYQLSPNIEQKNAVIHGLKEIWVQKLEKGSVRSGAISGHSIFYGANDRYVHEFDLESGKIKRRFYIGTGVTPRPLIYNSHLLIGEGVHETHHARMYSFDMKTGKFEKAFKTLGHTEGQALIETYNFETLLFVVAGKDGLYALSPDTLKEKWHAVDGHTDATVSIDEGIVYTGTGREKGNNNDRIYGVAYDFSTGKRLWKTELPISNWMHPIVGRKNVCYALGEIYFPSNVGLLYCLDKKTGRIDFAIPFDSPLIGKSLILKDQEKELAVVSSYKGDVCVVNMTTKTISWCNKTGTQKTTYALSSTDYDPKRNVLWYASLDNGLFAFDVNSGATKFHWLPKDSTYKTWNKTFASVTLDGDSLYTVDLKGVIRKINIY